ncbi:PqqD family protein [Streptomyces sp. NPDC094049]|uniref:PqqD family protein n=1 Tax=Streptomyces sp. NPDC094049 TaxID=3154987 RepID=UPI00332770F4
MNRLVRVFAADTADGVALMDLRTSAGAWRFLDPVGAGLWRQLACGTPRTRAVEELVEQWAARGAPPEQVRADLEALATRLDAEGLLDAAPHPQDDTAVPEVRFAETGARPGARVRIAAYAGLAAALLLLRCLPVRLVVRAARGAGRLPGRSATAAEADAVCAAVQRAVGWCRAGRRAWRSPWPRT